MTGTTRSPQAGRARPEVRRATATRPTGVRAPTSRGLRLPGGTDGNERLTVLAGALLLVLFAGLGITILRLGALMWEHLFLGLVLIGPVALKMGSTGYRFAKYYLGERTYRRKGPPPPMLRMLAPLLVLSTVGVFATGVALLLLGQSARNPVGTLHKGFFIVWIATCGVHVLAHLPEVLQAGSATRTTRRETLALSGGDPGSRATALPGARLRALALVASVAGGLVLAAALTGLFHAWTG